MRLTPEQQKAAIAKIATEMMKTKPGKKYHRLDALLGKVLEMELPEQDRELIGEWERNNREPT